MVQNRRLHTGHPNPGDNSSRTEEEGWMNRSVLVKGQLGGRSEVFLWENV